MYLSGVHGYASEGLSVGSFNGQKMGVSLVRGEKKGKELPARTHERMGKKPVSTECVGRHAEAQCGQGF